MFIARRRVARKEATPLLLAEDVEQLCDGYVPRLELLLPAWDCVCHVPSPWSWGWLDADGQLSSHKDSSFSRQVSQ